MLQPSAFTLGDVSMRFSSLSCFLGLCAQGRNIFGKAFIIINIITIIIIII
jgi:hypothetical protein